MNVHRAAASVAACAAAIAWSAVAAEPVQLKFAYPGPPQAKLYSQGVLPWSEQVTRESDGTIEVKTFVGMSLATPVNVYDRILNGVADFGFGLIGLYPEQFPRTTVAMLPFETRSPREASIALWRLYDSGTIAPDFARVRPVALSAFVNIAFHSKRPITTMADLRGQKISTNSRILGEVIEKLGGTPITMPPSDIYQALQRGTIDGAGIGWPGIMPFKLNEVVTAHLDAAVVSEGLFNLMSKETYERLPAKGKQTIDRLSGPYFSDLMGKAVQAMDDDGRNLTKSMPNQTINTLSAAEEARWRERVKPVEDAWVKATPDGARILAAYRTEVAKVRAGQ